MNSVPSQPSGLGALRSVAALALAALALVVLSPFWRPLAWAAVLAYLTWPIFRRLRARTHRPRLAAIVFTICVALGGGAVVAFLLLTLADEATALVWLFRDWSADGMHLPAWIAEREALVPWIERLRPTLEGADFETLRGWLGGAAGEVSLKLVALARGLARNVFHYVVCMVTLYVFYVNGERIFSIAASLAPLLFPTAPARFLERIGASVRAVVFGLLGTALVQGMLAGSGLAVAGLPSPVALGAATSLLSVVPAGGSAISLLCALWLVFEGRILAAILLALWALLVVSSVDNVLRPLLISGRGGIPFLLVFLGVLGGLAAFGVIGLILGPVVLSVAFSLLAEFSQLYSARVVVSGTAQSASERSADCQTPK